MCNDELRILQELAANCQEPVYSVIDSPRAMQKDIR